MKLLFVSKKIKLISIWLRLKFENIVKSFFSKSEKIIGTERDTRAKMLL